MWMDKLNSVFAWFRPLKVVRLDNGPCFTLEGFKTLCDDWGILRQPSSPLYPSSNGLVELALQMAK